MKKIGIGVVILSLVVAAYVYGTMSARKVITLPPAQWAQGSDSATAWREFSTSLEVAAARVYAATEDAQERLNGLQYLAQMAAVSLEMKLAKGSRVEPAFTDWMGDYRKFLGDSPDAVYHTAELSADYRYQVSGNRGDAEYLGFMLYGKQLNQWNRAAANISSQTLTFDSAGNFTIVLSKTAPDAKGVDWLKLDDDIHMLMVRQYYHGRAGKTQASLVIRNLDAPPRVDVDAAEIDSMEVAAGLRAAASFFTDTVDGAIALSSMLAASPNNIDPPKSYSPDFGGVFYPTNDNDYYGSWYKLADDEALVIEGAVPDAPYWSVSLQNRWMQSFPSEHQPTALNDHEIETSKGRYKIVLSHQKPPSGNWLSTAGKREGLLAIRYQLSENSEKPTLTRIEFSELGSGVKDWDGI